MKRTKPYSQVDITYPKKSLLMRMTFFDLSNFGQ